MCVLRNCIFFEHGKNSQENCELLPHHVIHGTGECKLGRMKSASLPRILYPKSKFIAKVGSGNPFEGKKAPGSICLLIAHQHVFIPSFRTREISDPVEPILPALFSAEGRISWLVTVHRLLFGSHTKHAAFMSVCSGRFSHSNYRVF